MFGISMISLLHSHTSFGADSDQMTPSGLIFCIKSTVAVYILVWLKPLQKTHQLGGASAKFAWRRRKIFSGASAREIYHFGTTTGFRRNRFRHRLAVLSEHMLMSCILFNKGSGTNTSYPNISARAWWIRFAISRLGQVNEIGLSGFPLRMANFPYPTHGKASDNLKPATICSKASGACPSHLRFPSLSGDSSMT